MKSSKPTKPRISIEERAYSEYLKNRSKYLSRNKWGTEETTPLSSGKHFGKKRFGGRLQTRYKETSHGAFDQSSNEAIMPFEEFTVEITARTAGLKGSERQRKSRYWARWIAARQAGVLTQTEAIALKTLAEDNGVKGAESWSVREMMRDRSYLSLVYEQLKEDGYTPEEAFKIIGREVLGSD